MSTERQEEAPQSVMVASAQGWQRIQLAVLGFVGLCGVLRSGDAVSGPDWVEGVAGWLAIAALLLACAATYLVGRVAWPWRGVIRGAPGPGAHHDPAAERTLRAGVVMTYLAVAVISLAALAGWWPSEGEGSGGPAAVQVVSTDGRSWCGQLAEASPGVVRVMTGTGAVDIDSTSVAQLLPATGC